MGSGPIQLTDTDVRENSASWSPDGLAVKLTANGRRIDLTTRRTTLQTQALAAVGTDTRSWDKATIT